MNQLNPVQLSDSDRVRNRVLPPLIGVILLLQGIFIYTFFNQQQQRLKSLEQDTQERVDNLIEQEQFNTLNMLNAVMTAMVRDQHLMEDVQAQDYQALEAFNRPVFEKLRTEEEITHFYYHQPNRLVGLRLHSDQRGDLNNRTTILEAEATGKPSAGLEQGATGNAVLRSIYPWFADIPRLDDHKDWFAGQEGRELVGYLELGVEFEDVLQRVKRVLRVELALAVDKTYLDQNLWEAKATQLGIDPGWDNYPQLVVTNNTFGELPSEVAAVLNQPETSAIAQSIRYSQDNQDYQAIFIPYENVEGETIGYVIAFKNITTAVRPARAAMVLASVLSVLLSTGLIVLFYHLLGRVQTDLAQSRQSLVTAQAELKALNEELEDRVRARTAEVQATSADLQAIISNLADALLVVDLDGNITRYNPALTQMLNLGNLNLMGINCRELGQPQLVEIIEQCHTHADQVLAAEVDLGQHHVGQAVATPIAIVDESGIATQVGTVALIRDVTQEKEVDRMKTDFISTVSHELRTPLTSVLGFASIIQEKLEEGVFPQLSTEERKTQRTVRRVRDNLNIIVSEAERLTALINDVLDIAKMEAGKLEWKMEPLPMGEVVDRAIAAVSSLMEQSGLHLVTDIDPELPEISGDRDRLIQVVINLLSNAIKFTENGTITCRAKPHDHNIHLAVQDTGMGIAPEDLGKVFDKFKQVGETLTDKPKGTGLGLPICKQIVEYHGGTIWAESELGVGSTFQFTLPQCDRTSTPDKITNFDSLVRQLQTRTTTTAQITEPANQKKILVVDDDSSIRELLRQFLAAQDYIVFEAKDGLAAVEQAKRHAPDLIILDVMMPKINGFDTAAILKNDPLTLNTPIIMLSIFEDKARGYRLGIDRYLTKPIENQALLAEIGGLLSQGQSNKKILVVDSNASTLANLSQVLQAQGYQVSEAANSAECIEKALSVRPDTIIVDSGLSQQTDLMTTLRFEKGLENVFFILLGDENQVEEFKTLTAEQEI
ncbi:response regulator [Spirulina major]|uniref:response regulator n=1 Tax=Spirulina major TaxID=270636 RepID=UPI000932BCDC|nr:response regulator [Spirulina major]